MARLVLLLLLPLHLTALLPSLARAEETAATAPAPTPITVADTVTFNSGKASLLWRALAPGGGGSSTLQFMLGRLAELTPGGDVVRRVPSLARLTPSKISNGESRKREREGGRARERESERPRSSH
jgi:hypothetical protein